MVVPREGKGGSSEAVATVGSEPTVAAIAPSSPPLATTPRSPTVTTGRVSTPTSPSPVVTPLRQPLHATPSRRSMRQVTATDGALASDEDSLSRAMRRKAASNLDSTGCLPVHQFAPFMVVAAAYGGPRPLYGGVYTVGGHGEGFYFPTWVAA
nr:uncharacterized protein LOC127341416 [Lolium perenne]